LIKMEHKIGYGTRFKSFVLQSKRVWHVMKRPSSKEFWTMSKVSALGILAIGLIGFIIANLITGFF
jgi:protein translocase SEC61 complex gamma subunit